jgi:peptidoglycan/xylan/chitin deacetylase (PgdA/CDA1 family)
VLDLATGCYPAFLSGGSIVGAVPVFHFHEVSRAWLEPRLQYLADNHYRTLTSDEIARFVIEGVSPGDRAVGLTFDDAWASVWTVAAPLLRRFNMRAIVFAIPGRVPDAATVRPAIDAADPASVERPEGPVFATWPELQAMQASGVADIQSHTRSHAMMFSDPTVTGFVTPDYAGESILNHPVIGDVQGPTLDADALGAPLYVRRSRMSDARRFLQDPLASDRCRAHVAQNGGRAFFDRPRWRAELENLAHADAGRFEDDDARTAIIRDELADGRAILNDKLKTNAVKHVALPWGIAGDIARRAVADTGHVTAYAERPLRRRLVRARDDRFGLMRLNGKFLTCLPGQSGRQWFFSSVR